MHVAIFSHNYPPHPGGLEVVVRSVAEGLAGRGHRVTVLSTAWEEARGVAEEGGARIHRVPAWHGSEPWGVPYPVPLPSFRGAARALAEMAGADLVHAHGCLYATTLLARRLARKAGKPLVLTEHVGWVPYKNPLIRAVQHLAWATVGRHVLGAARAATTYNHRVVAWLGQRRAGLPVTYIGNGVDTETFRPRPAERSRLRAELGLPADEVLILFAGRESEKKNLGAVLALPRDGYRLITCGAERRVPADVLDLGLVPYRRMSDLFAAVDAMVHPSVGEGFPLAVQEAMAAGVPLVLLWEDGYGEWLEPDVVAACRDEAALGPALERVAADPAWRAELSERERRWAVERWSWGATVAAYERLFLDEIARGGGR